MSNNIVKHGQLQEIAQDLWNKAKKRDIEAITYEASTKKIKATNSQTPALALEAQLTNLVAIDERAKFQQDVSVDKAGSVNNLHIGTLNGTANRDRFSGCRSMTSKSFVDGYVNHLLVVLDDALNVNDPTNWKVWAIKKGATRNADVVFKAYHTSALISSTVQQCTIQNQTVKCAKITIDEEFRDEVYFIVQCDGKPVRVMTNTPPEHAQDIVNLSKAPSNTPNSTIDWNQFNANQNMVAICLVGRESISSLAEKLKSTQADGSNYVLKTDTTDTGGETQHANKVVKLGADGKINSNMIPEIAINRVLQATNKGNALQLIGEGKDRLQVGDVVVLQDTSKIYIYKGRPDSTDRNDFDRDFLEISMGNGTVKSVNTILPEANGNVTVNADNINLSSTDTTKVKTELDKKISTITLHNDKKHLTITKATGTTPEQLDLTNAFAADNISYTGTIGGAAKTNVKEAIDALNEEAKKGVKKIHNGTPDAQGNINVAVNQAGTTGITMTFGTTGGTPVQIATYMTTDEVNQIKALFV